jgi:glycosyltransferase involved in cell wall biosynthesis
MARGLPVFFHLNASRSHLEELYRDATSPERCEHFGVAIVEVMSAGCIAVVANRGGPAEIVENRRNGFHFRDCTELAAERHDPWVSAMATAAVDRAQAYAKMKFAQSWRRLLDIDSADTARHTEDGASA